MQILAAPSGGKLGAFTDTFAGSGALDPRWSNTFGSSWSRLFDDAYTSTAASSYPKATFDAGTSAVTVRADVGVANTFGWGVLFWVVDANNWWAAHTYRTSYSIAITGCTYPCGTPAGLPPGVSIAGGGCEGCACYRTDTGEITGYASCQIGVIGYTTGYNYQVDIIRSVNGTLSLVNNLNVRQGDIGAGQTIQYVQIQTTLAGQITLSAAMSTGHTNTPLTITPSSPNMGKRHGMIIVPLPTPTQPGSGGTQADRIETFTYSPA